MSESSSQITVSGVREVLSNVTGGVADAVVSVSGVVVSGVSQVSQSVGGVVSHATSGVTSNVGEVYHQATNRMVRCLTSPPQTLPLGTDSSDNTPTGNETRCFTSDNRGIVQTPRAFNDSGISSRQSQPSQSEEEETDSLQEENLSVCKELGVTQSMLEGEKSEVITRLTTLEQKVRSLILETSPGSSRRRVLVHTLVAVREHLQKVQENSEAATEMGGSAVRGHLLLPRKTKRSSCDVCSHTIWDIFTSAYACSECSLTVHGSCRQDIKRYCPSSYFSYSSFVTSSPPNPEDTILSLPTLAISSPVNDQRLNSSDSLASSPQSDSLCSSTSTMSPSPKKSVDSPLRSTKSPSVTPLKSLQSLAALTTASESKGIRQKGKSRSRSVPESPLSHLITKICPEVGMGAQDFRCAECDQLLTNHGSTSTDGECQTDGTLSCVPFAKATQCAWSEPRLCHYSGLYYCPACHWANSSVIPALIIRNWDFSTRYVSRCSYQLLNYILKKPLLEIEKLNPHLFVFVQELCEVKSMRADLMSMKQYLISCRVATESKLLRRLSTRQHFIDSATLYSLQDLLDINDGSLLKELQSVYDSFSQHIKEDCLVCQGRGHICLHCSDTAAQVLYPFDADAVQCSVCYSVMHTECFNLKKTCAKCLVMGKEGPASIIGALTNLQSTPVLRDSSCHPVPRVATSGATNTPDGNATNC